MKGRVRRCAVICALAIVLGGCGGSAPATAEKSASVVRTDENSIVYFKTDKGLNAFLRLTMNLRSIHLPSNKYVREMSEQKR